MATEIIANPLQAARTVSNYDTLKSDAGEKLLQSNTEPFLAGGTIPPGSIVCLLSPSGPTVKPSVVVKATARLFSSVVGVSDNPVQVVAGQVVNVVTYGLAFVAATGAPADGNTATVQANTNEAGVMIAETTAADTPVGSVLGHFLGAEGADGRAPVWVDRK